MAIKNKTERDDKIFDILIRNAKCVYTNIFGSDWTYNIECIFFFRKKYYFVSSYNDVEGYYRTTTRPSSLKEAFKLKLTSFKDRQI